MYAKAERRAAAKKAAEQKRNNGNVSMKALWKVLLLLLGWVVALSTTSIILCFLGI